MRGRRSQRETATQGTIQVDRRAQPLRAQCGELLVEQQQRSLRRKDIELRPKARS